MQINGIQGGNAGTGQVTASQTADSVSKNLRNQIINLQKQMQELSSNKDMSVEDKMKKRRELQQQIFELQNQLRQHEMEQRKEAQKENSVSMEDMLGGGRQEQVAEGVSTNFSDTGMQAMISADSALSQAKTQGSVVRSLKGRARILKSEMEQDKGETSIKRKQGELAALEQRAMQASVSQVSSLSSTVNAMKEAANEETEKAAARQEGETKERNVSETEKLSQDERETVSAGWNSDLSMAEKYNPVDVLL